MSEPVLVIMAAGMGSRYGGLKQIDPVDEQGHIIIDFSLYDAVKAGIKKAVFIIKKEDEKEFREVIGDRMERHMEVAYAFQRLDNLPKGVEVPAGRTKPWGTGQAVLSCLSEVDGPFIVINADDYYGHNAFKTLYDFLLEVEDDEKYQYGMVGYVLENTLTDKGHVARGVCRLDERGYLKNIRECTHIEKREGQAACTEDDGNTWLELDNRCTVSMNLWGFTKSILAELEAGFPEFLKQGLATNPLKCEYFLPDVVGNLIKQQKADVKVFRSEDRWYGMTYKEDKKMVMRAISSLKEEGVYPENLWEEYHE